VVIALVYDGHAKNTANLGLSVFLTSSIACSTELPADLVVVFFLDRWGRRALAFGSLLGAAVFSLICVGIPVEHAALAAGLAIVGRFCVNITLNIGHQYGAELIPTSVRAQGISYVHMAGYIASLVSPYIVDLARFNRVLPLIVLGLLALFGAVVGFLLPETMGATLPQTMEEGENFGRDQSLWDFPCCRRRRRQQKTTDSNNKTPQVLTATVTNIVESSQPTILQLNHKRID
jgi:MFS family permease